MERAAVFKDDRPYVSSKRESDGAAEIQIHLGNTKERLTLFKAGSLFSKEITPNFSQAEATITELKNLEAEGKTSK